MIVNERYKEKTQQKRANPRQRLTTAKSLSKLLTQLLTIFAPSLSQNIWHQFANYIFIFKKQLCVCILRNLVHTGSLKIFITSSLLKVKLHHLSFGTESNIKDPKNKQPKFQQSNRIQRKRKEKKKETKAHKDRVVDNKVREQVTWVNFTKTFSSYGSGKK